MDFLSFTSAMDDHGLEVFSTNDAVKTTGLSKATVNTSLHRWAEQGKLTRLKRGWYAFDDIENKYKLQAVFDDTYVSLRSAFEHHGGTTQRYNTLDLVTTTKCDDTTIHGTDIAFHHVKDSLYHGYEKILLDETDVFVANPEKAVIDAVYFSDNVPLSSTMAFIEAKQDAFSAERLEDYLETGDTAVLNKRVAYLFSQVGVDLDVPYSDTYEKLNKAKPCDGEKDSDWKLILNDDLC